MDDIDFGHLLFQFDGRINRGKFWLGVVLIWGLQIIIALLVTAVDLGGFSLVGWLALIALIWPALAVSIKRWHDRGKSGWWVLIGLVPLIGFWWVLIECGFLQGDSGPNEYGPDPLAV